MEYKHTVSAFLLLVREAAKRIFFKWPGHEGLPPLSDTKKRTVFLRLPSLGRKQYNFIIIPLRLLAR